jgi:hypothetical protein
MGSESSIGGNETEDDGDATTTDPQVSGASSSPVPPGKLNNTDDAKNGDPLLAGLRSSPLPPDSPTPGQELHGGSDQLPVGRAANTLRNIPSRLATMWHRDDDTCSETTNLHPGPHGQQLFVLPGDIANPTVADVGRPASPPPVPLVPGACLPCDTEMAIAARILPIFIRGPMASN